MQLKNYKCFTFLCKFDIIKLRRRVTAMQALAGEVFLPCRLFDFIRKEGNL